MFVVGFVVCWLVLRCFVVCIGCWFVCVRLVVYRACGLIALLYVA